jgi:hypothetical protein
MGIHNSKGEIILNPAKDMPIEDDDELIVFAEDDSTIFYFQDPVFNPTLKEIPSSIVEPQSHRVALLNWTTKTSIILEKLCSYLPKGSELCTFVSAKVPEMDSCKISLNENYPDIDISMTELDLNDLESLDNINPQDFDSILILSPGGSTIEEMDAYVISMLIRIRQILISKKDSENNNLDSKDWPKLITEVMDSENIDIILNSGVEDFMVSNQFVSQIMAQVSEEPMALDVYDDLFQSEGSELYIKPASYYFDFKDSTTITIPYGECVQAARLRNEVILGLQIHADQKNKDNMFGIVLIPNKDDEFTLSEKDGLIALAEDET